MDIFFHDKKTYISHLPPDLIRHEVNNVASTRWYKLSRGNLSASINADDTFSVKNKIVILTYFWPGGWVGPFVTLTGKIEDRNNQTIVTTVARPNYLASAAFFLFIFMSVVFAVNGSKTKDDDVPVWIVMPVMAVLFGSALFFSVRSLRKRFEKVFQLS